MELTWKEVVYQFVIHGLAVVGAIELIWKWGTT